MKEGSLTQIARREGGITRSGKISITWARKKLANPRTSAVVKKKLVFFLNTNKPGTVKKRAARKKNPVPASKAYKFRRAVRLFQNFRGQDPEFVDEWDFDVPEVCMEIGRLDGVLYTTIREGKKEQYIHEFTGKSCPKLAASWDGKQLVILGGSYDFTAEGIKDRK